MAPGRVELPSLPRLTVMLCEYRGHPLAVLRVDACHRHQKLHRYVRGDFALPHVLLDCLGEEFDQCQPARHPTHTAVEPPCQFLQPVSESLF